MSTSSEVNRGLEVFARIEITNLVEISSLVVDITNFPRS